MAGDSDEGAEDERNIELSALQSIYPELVIDAADTFSAHIDIAVEPLQPLAVRFVTPAATLSPPPLTTSLATLSVATHSRENLSTAVNVEPKPQIAAQATHYLSYLPPLCIAFKLPDEYPTHKPPQVKAKCAWMPQAKIKEIEGICLGLWNQLGQEQVVFTYIDHLRELAEQSFGLGAEGRKLLEVPSELEAFLLDHECTAKRAKFEQETFECGICLEPKKGSVCHRLVLCSHVFCVECLQDFYSACISEGDVGRVQCTAPGCVEDEGQLPSRKTKKRHRNPDRTLEPSELLQIPLENDIIQRYIKLKRKKLLESDRSTVYCPRQWCQGPARSQTSRAKAELVGQDDSDSDEEPAEPAAYDPNTPQQFPPPAERLAICEDCTFAFCKVCKASWHGEYFSCFPRSQAELTAEERASEEYMTLHTQPCPTCDARAQKTHGCNHMICAQCQTHFCYLCGAYLVRDNPYAHYNTPKQACYMRLWELEAGDGDDVDHGFAGGIPVVVEAEDEEPPPNQAEQAHQRAVPPAQAGQRPGAVGDQRGQGQPNGNAGLQRFLQLVQDDEEDEWDSDEMDDDDDADELGFRWIG